MPRAVYLEIDSQADNVNGVAAVVYAALVSLAFDKANEKKEIVGLRVESDFSFEFFDLEENIRQLQE